MNISVIAAHPDDEVLGCGGAIAKHIQAGDEVHVLIMGEGVTSRQLGSINQTEVNKLADAAHKANNLLGVTSLSLEKLPDNRFDTVDRLELIKIVEAFIVQHKSDIVYTHHMGDLNVDHRRISEAVVTACRPLPTSKLRLILFFEVLSSTDWWFSSAKIAFIPNYFINISCTLENKLKALKVYHMEMREWPHARSLETVEHLARFRGAFVGLEAAEAFVLGRYIQY